MSLSQVVKLILSYTRRGQLSYQKLNSNSILTGLKAQEFPKDPGAQTMQANIIIKDLVTKVLGREETFSISVRRGSGILRYARGSTMFLVPPIEVSIKARELNK